jgi:hypothetical protein
MKIICNCHNTSVMLLNKTGNSVLRDMLHILYQGNLYFLNIKKCEGTGAKIMSCMSNTNFHYNHTCSTALHSDLTYQTSTNGTINVQSTDRKSNTTTSKVWLSMCWLTQNSKSFNIVLSTSPVPNIIHIRQKILVNCYVHTKVQYDFHCTNFHKMFTC